jgi:hypothetical protein
MPLASARIAPRLSIVTPVYDPPLAALQQCIRSVVSQSFTDWEWWLVDDCSTRPEVTTALDDAARVDARIHVIHRDVNGGIVAASNDALAACAGEFVVLLDHDDAIAAGALAEVTAALDASPRPVDYLYTDETHVRLDGNESIPFRKPSWSPERFRSSMYTCHLSVLRRQVVDELGGFRVGFDGSQDHDLVLRVTEGAAERGHAIVHLPIFGYLWRTVTTSVSRADGTVGAAVENGRRAVQEQCDRLGRDAMVEHGPLPGTYRTVRNVAGRRITVVVPTAFEPAARRPHQLAALPTLRDTDTSATFGADVTWVVAHPADVVQEVRQLALEAAESEWRFLPVAAQWSLAAALQRTTEAYRADVYVVMAPGTVPSPATPDWLRALVGAADDAGVGLVGGLSHDNDGVVVHAGWDIPNYRQYLLEGRRVGASTTGNDLLIERECSQVSLCLAAFRHEVWSRVGSATAGEFDDAGAALSTAAALAGYRNLWTPHAQGCRRLHVPLGVTPRRG